MDLDNDELIATRYAEIKEAVETLKNRKEYLIGENKTFEKAIKVALRCMENYIDENGENHVPRID